MWLGNGKKRLIVGLGVLFAFSSCYASQELKQLQFILAEEMFATVCALLGLCAAYKRWLWVYLACLLGFSVALFDAWFLITALGALILYFPLSMLSWLNFHRASYGGNLTLINLLCWPLMFFGVGLMFIAHFITVFRAIISG